MGTFREHSGNIQGNLVNIQETFSEHSGKNKPQKKSGNIQGTFSLAVHLVFEALHHLAHLDGNIQGTFSEHSVNIQETFSEK
jgi:hypothetical protein